MSKIYIIFRKNAEKSYVNIFQLEAEWKLAQKRPSEVILSPCQQVAALESVLFLLMWADLFRRDVRSADDFGQLDLFYGKLLLVAVDAASERLSN